MIVITAPTSNIGGALVRRLLNTSDGEGLRLVARDPAKLPEDVTSSPRVEIVEGSHGDPVVIDKALAGAGALFWLAPPNFHAAHIDDVYLGFSQGALAAVRAHSVGHVVGVSALGRGTAVEQEAGLVTATFKMDDAFAATGVAYRALANPSFIDGLRQQLRAIEATGQLTDILPADLAVPRVATQDIAAVAAELLENRDWTGVEERPVLGPEDVSGNDVARILTEVLGRPVAYQQITADEQRAMFQRFGASDAFATGIVDMMVAKAHGLDSDVTRTPEWTTPTTVSAWVRDNLLPTLSR